MSRPSVPEADAILGKKWDVLDQGFVRFVDYMGGDDAIVQAARVSYGQGTKSKSEDAALIDYLMRKRHTSPFEMVELKFHIKMPIFVARQWIRHRTANVNEYSGRYSEMPDEFWMPTDGWRAQDTKNKQGSEGAAQYKHGLYSSKQEGDFIGAEDSSAEQLAFDEYHRRIDAGVSREMARSCLPLSTYTQWYWKIDLHNLLHFLGLRMDSHAQPEIKAYADIIGDEIVSKVAPATWNSFLNWHHNMKGTLFGGDEMEALRQSIDIQKLEACASIDMRASRVKELIQKLA